MINVLIPCMGNSTFFKDSYFPKHLIEINGKTMLELVIDNYKPLSPKNYIFVFSDEDCKKFHIDSSAKILSPMSNVVKLQNQTSGALCTCLMAIDYIDNENPLLIANSDQIINVNYTDVISYFESIHSEIGVITFPSVHPRWSYVRKKDDGVIEVAEKRPISKDAIAGVYYFKKGCDFVSAAKKVLIKQNSLEDRYYISSTLNEIILENRKVGYYDIKKEQYKSFYSPAKIKEFEEGMSR